MNVFDTVNVKCICLQEAKSNKKAKSTTPNSPSNNTSNGNHSMLFTASAVDTKIRQFDLKVSFGSICIYLIHNNPLVSYIYRPVNW